MRFLLKGFVLEAEEQHLELVFNLADLFRPLVLQPHFFFLDVNFVGLVVWEESNKQVYDHD